MNANAMRGIQPYTRLTDRFLAKSRHPRASDHTLVSQVNSVAADLGKLPDQNLADRMDELREQVRIDANVTDEKIASIAFALAKEAARRTIGMAHYDVQLLAGIALSSGAIAEMQTGEGKTLTSVLPVILHALKGEGVHVATVNSYLTIRDFSELRPVYEILGFSVGISEDGASDEEKRAAYDCDITYATGYELGFDYLRDEVTRRGRRRSMPGSNFRKGLRGMRENQQPIVQKSHKLAIIDEIDSVLIDEGNTPLILSGPSSKAAISSHVYKEAARVASTLVVGSDFVVHFDKRMLHLTQHGSDRIYETANPSVTHLLADGALSRPWAAYVEQALRAKLLFERNVHYVISNDEVRIVDEYTGRIFDERSWSDGLHQAVETKEGVTVTEEKRSIARVSRQRYFQLYRQLCGMSGTAAGHEQELFGFYRLPVVVIPLRRPSQRVEQPTAYFPDGEAKWDAITQEIIQRNRNGQPVLVGTRTIANSEYLAHRLSSTGLNYQLLNGVQDEDESQLIGRAGQLGTITIATNMAGRGTDIKLSVEARNVGGLHVIAAERHDSFRVDRQLIGRCARQGDPGSCRFFVAADDDLLQRLDSSLSDKMKRAAKSGGTVSTEYDDAIRRLQSLAEQENYNLRRRLMQQELWLNEVLNTVA